MKIGNYEIKSPFSRINTEKVLDADTAPSFLRTKSNVVKYKVEGIADYYNAYLNDDKVRLMVDDLIGNALGNGFYTTVEKVSKILKKSPSKELADAFGEHFRLDALLPNIKKNSLIAGFCPVETIMVKGPKDDPFKNMSLTIIRPDTIDPNVPLKVDPRTREILEITQKVNNKKNVIKKKANTHIVNFVHGQLGNDVRGVSFVRGMLELLNMLNQATESVDEILKRYISPLGIWKSKKAIARLKKLAENRNPGEDIFLGKLSDTEFKEKIVEFISIDPRVPFWQFIEFLDRRVWSYSRASDIWYLRNATEASATIIDNVTGRHVTAIQRATKRAVEQGWYAPLIELYLKDKEVPAWVAGAEPTGLEDVQVEQFLTAGVNVGYITQEQYAFLLKQMGFKLSEAGDDEEEKKDDEDDKDKPPDKKDEQPKKDELPKKDEFKTG